MTETENLVLEILKDMQARMKRLEEGLVGLHTEIGALGQQVAGLATAVYAGHDRFRDMERRIERIEHRLNLTD
ncbi:MAG: hypothetical protein ACHBNF_19760 [Chromatiales bacterium]